MVTPLKTEPDEFYRKKIDMAIVIFYGAHAVLSYQTNGVLNHLES